MYTCIYIYEYHLCLLLQYFVFPQFHGDTGCRARRELSNAILKSDYRLTGVEIWLFPFQRCRNIPCRNIPCRDIPWRDEPCHNIPCSNIPCHDIPCCNISCRYIPCPNIISPGEMIWMANCPNHLTSFLVCSILPSCQSMHPRGVSPSFVYICLGHMLKGPPALLGSVHLDRHHLHCLI